MAQYVYSVDHKIVSEDDIPREYTAAFDKLRFDLNAELISMTCPKHHREAKVVLAAEGGHVHLAGFGPCCEEFGNSLRNAVSQAGLEAPGTMWKTVKTSSSPRQ